ncbi:MAG: ABC transporter ATP-binding protein [Bacteroidales bacterium]|nr:ABC transporter ATP-binding protein [Bacteroidales bacterium]
MVEEFTKATSALAARSLVLGYRRGSPIAGPINVDIEKGSLVLLKGSNGSGKTTFLKTAAGLLKPLSGSIDAPGAVLIPTRVPKVKGFTVMEFIKTFLSFYGKGSQAAASAYEKWGRNFELEELKDRDISTLSDGQFQKVCLYPAIASGSPLILLDEPTAFLDADSRVQLMEFLSRLTRGESPVTVIFSSHDLAVCTPYCDKVMEF